MTTIDHWFTNLPERTGAKLVPKLVSLMELSFVFSKVEGNAYARCLSETFTSQTTPVEVFVFCPSLCEYFPCFRVIEPTELLD